MTNHMMEVSRLTSKYGDPELENLDKRLSVPWPFFLVDQLGDFRKSGEFTGYGSLEPGAMPHINASPVF